METGVFFFLCLLERLLEDTLQEFLLEEKQIF